MKEFTYRVLVVSNSETRQVADISTHLKALRVINTIVEPWQYSIHGRPLCKLQKVYLDGHVEELEWCQRDLIGVGKQSGGVRLSLYKDKS